MMKLINLRLERSSLLFLLCACVALSAVSEARSAEPEARRSVAADGTSADADHPGGLLFHGNYCGPGGRPGARPVDALDAACMRHDACARSTTSLPSCACNARLQREAEAVAQNPAQPPDIQFLASITAGVAPLMICDPALQAPQDPMNARSQLIDGALSVDSYRLRLRKGPRAARP